MSSAGTAAVEPGVAVRRAADGEARACRLMMPEVFGPAFAPDLWVAIDRETSLIVGAAAVAWRPLSKPPGFPVQVHVPSPLRRRGIGRALVEAVAESCSGSAACLHAWTGVRAGGPAAPTLPARTRERKPGVGRRQISKRISDCAAGAALAGGGPAR